MDIERTAERRLGAQQPIAPVAIVAQAVWSSLLVLSAIGTPAS